MGIKDNFEKALKKGITKASMEKGAPNTITLRQMLKNSVNIELKKKKEEEMDEATAAANAGAFAAPLGFDPRFKKKKKEKKEEVGEATTAASSGQYSGPQIWAKNEKNWRGAAKTQWPGGQFVKVKKRCRKFPYCNQGDINALDLTENKKIKQLGKEGVENFQIKESYKRYPFNKIEYNKWGFDLVKELEIVN